MTNVRGRALTLPLKVHLKSSQRTFAIGELARRANVRPSAVRYYESVGLLPPAQRAQGKRVYLPADVTKLQALVRARQLGFSVRELKQWAEREPPQWRELARTRVGAMQRRIDELSDVRDELRRLAECACKEPISCVLLVNAGQRHG